jgi:hypothetical protein
LPVRFPCNIASSSARSTPSLKRLEPPRKTLNLSPKPVPKKVIFDHRAPPSSRSMSLGKEGHARVSRGGRRNADAWDGQLTFFASNGSPRILVSEAALNRLVGVEAAEPQPTSAQ